MMWMMLGCVALIAVLFLGGSRLPSGGILWQILIVGFVVAHLWMMFRGHGHGSSDDEPHNMNDMKQVPPENTSNTDEKKGRSDNSSYH